MPCIRSPLVPQVLMIDIKSRIFEMIKQSSGSAPSFSQHASHLLYSAFKLVCYQTCLHSIGASLAVVLCHLFSLYPTLFHQNICLVVGITMHIFLSRRLSVVARSENLSLSVVSVCLCVCGGEGFLSFTRRHFGADNSLLVWEVILNILEAAVFHPLEPAATPKLGKTKCLQDLLNVPIRHKATTN